MDKPQIEQKIKEDLLNYLNAGKKVTLTWDCGGDQAIVTTFIEGKELSSFFNGEYQEHEFPALLEHFVITELELPDVGEFSLEGTGEIVKENNKLVIIYEALDLRYEGDYEEDEENTKENTEEDIENEEEYNSSYVNASPEEYAEYSGKKVLFTL